MTKTAFRMVRIGSGLVLAFVLVSQAQAAGSGMPWENPFDTILRSVEGPVFKIIATLAILVVGTALAFGEATGAVRRALQVVMGLCIGANASSFFLTFIGYGGGALL
ncbi:TrbC/VirB2 family protein [Caulobacter segnis]|uniref:TrbC/VirB2 family protein n=1 Tax=Caulobacter segnis TaxID=88688 RepID=UPI0024104BA1|nr:TrbC/VirB2 family protein [Caulobacter segnis]MDG2522897.1 TrbC/VirB2 family protein [Caulobacter segnis]